MGLYNMVHGINPDTETILRKLGLTIYDFYRFRDCHQVGNTIHVLTRAGGNNRECFECEEVGVHHNDCVVSVYAKLINHPAYVKDYDCLDGTYATFIFRVNEIED